MHARYIRSMRYFILLMIAGFIMYSFLAISGDSFSILDVPLKRFRHEVEEDKHSPAHTFTLKKRTPLRQSSNKDSTKRSSISVKTASKHVTQGSTKSAPHAKDALKGQNFNGTLLILAGLPQDFVVPFTKRFDNSTDKMSLLLRRYFFGPKGYSTTLATKDLFNTSCPIDYGCQFTIDTSRFAESDVVLMYSPGDVAKNGKAWVKRARPEQMFAYFYYEQPHHYTNRVMEFYNQRIGFNWTLHYQQDATFSWPYGRTIEKRVTEEPAVPDNKSYALGRKRTILWVVSRCETNDYQRREHYVAELIRFIDIDVYGQCTNSGKKDPININNAVTNYKFIISFENADCDDYITEKFFSRLQAGVVPIVIGTRAHYSKLAPPHSYIQADEFNTPQDLAVYLHLLDKNDLLYNRYFEWKRSFGVQFMPLPICELCKRMKEIYYKPSKIDMLKYLSIHTRCYIYKPTNMKDWMIRIANQTTNENPWVAIRKYNSKGKALRFS